MGLTKVLTKQAPSVTHSAFVPVIKRRRLMDSADRFSEARNAIARPRAPRPATKPPCVLAHTSITTGSTQSGARRLRRNRNRTATNIAKNANVNNWGRKRKKRESVDAHKTNTGTHTCGLRVVNLMAAARKKSARPPTMHFNAISPRGPANRYASHSAMCAPYSKVTHRKPVDV